MAQEVTDDDTREFADDDASAQDRLLVESAQNGDVDAFEEIVRRHYPRVYSVCRGICGRDSDAEDAAQDTFVRAWRAVHNFRGDSKLSTWLFRIATNVSLTLVTRRKDHAAGDTLPDRPDLTHSPEGQLEGLERVQVVQTALQGMSADARAAFILRDVEGLPYEEIAEQLGISLSAVKSRIFRARQAVADALSALDRAGVAG